MVTTTAKLTLDEYRDREAIASVRHEYRNGEIVEMPGGSINHSRLLMALYAMFESLLDGVDYEAFNSDMRLWVPECNQAMYPDLMVVAGEPIANGDRGDEIVNPMLIAEVLSPSTSSYDRGDKFAAYRTVESFREYLLIEQGRPAIEHHWKTEDGRWHLEELRGLEVTIALEHLPVRLSVAQLYRRVRFEG